MPAYQHLAYRRNAQAAARRQQIRVPRNLESLEKAREDFGFFCEYVADKPPAAHHKEWHRQFVTGNDSNCLIKIAGPNVDLLAPRGSAKSTVLGLFTAWAIGVHTMAKMPLQILYLSYTVDIARSKSATIKRIIESKRYQEVFPKVRLLKNVTSNEYWSIDHRFAGIDTTGEEQFTLCAAGLKGSVTSKRSHLCLTGDTLVTTNVGQVPIKAIYEDPDRYQIAVRNSETNQIDWSNVGAVTRRFTKGIVDITTASGNRISATPEHPFVTQDGKQKRAGDLSAGDVLVRASNRRQDKELSFLRGAKEKNTTYLRGLFSYNTGFSGKANLSAVWPTVLRNLKSLIPTSFKKSISDLLQPSVYWSSITKASGKILSSLSSIISTSQSQNNLLLAGVCESPSFTANEKDWEQQLPTRLQFQRFSGNETVDFGKGQFYLRWMQYKGAEVVIKQRNVQDKSLRTSYRPQKDKQYPAKFDYIMSPVSCGASSGNGQGWSPEPVSRVEFLSEREEFVYDLEVEHLDHNFIANGLNVLNCIIDDAIKSAADISNPDIRKQMQENWNAVIAPTMFEGGRAICLGTRFRHDDIHSTTFNPQNNWIQIVLSAILNDPKTGDEFSYWPEMWSLDYLKEKKRQAPIAFSFQYMNQVIRQNELSLAPELIVKAEIATEFDTIAVGVDLSAGTKEKNDYTVMTLAGRIGDQIHVIDYRRLRVMGNLEKLDALKELLNDWSIVGRDENGNYYPTYSTCDIYSEAVQYQASLESDFKRVCLNNENLYNLNWHAVKGFRADKLARFRGCMGLFEDRKIIFNRFRNFTAMFEELTNFGISSHDDCVDSLVWVINGLMRKGKLQVDY